MCRGLKVHRSGFYAWLVDQLSPRAKANEALTATIKEFYDQSMGIYGSPASSLISRRREWRVAKIGLLG